VMFSCGIRCETAAHLASRRESCPLKCDVHGCVRA
jgi:hypothetical protein